MVSWSGSLCFKKFILSLKYFHLTPSYPDPQVIHSLLNSTAETLLRAHVRRPCTLSTDLNCKVPLFTKSHLVCQVKPTKRFLINLQVLKNCLSWRTTFGVLTNSIREYYQKCVRFINLKMVQNVFEHAHWRSPACPRKWSWQPLRGLYYSFFWSKRIPSVPKQHQETVKMSQLVGKLMNLWIKFCKMKNFYGSKNIFWKTRATKITADLRSLCWLHATNGQAGLCCHKRKSAEERA